MAKGVNKTISIGNLCADPETRYSPNGNAVTKIRIAMNNSYKDKAGQTVENTEFMPVVFFNKLAEIAGQYLKKGSKVYIEGSLRTQKWQDKQTGADRYTTEIVASNMHLLDSKNSERGAGHPTAPQPSEQGLEEDTNIPF